MSSISPASISTAVVSDMDAMRLAIRLAMLGRGAVEPNPMVGCVIAKGGRIIGQGYHKIFGGPHAEPLALANCRESPTGATAYVTLEPCCHLKKKTPPCVPQLIRAGLANVLCGSLDPNPLVSGQGLSQLRADGIFAKDGLMAPEARQLNAAFFKQMDHRRPYVTLKWAQTADGKVAGVGGKRMYISSEQSLAALHVLRSRCDAILVGIRTVLADDPQLTARLAAPSSYRPLRRIVLDPDLRIPLTSQLARTTVHGPVTVYCSNESYRRKFAGIAALNAAGIEVMPLPPDPAGGLSLEHMLDDLGGRSVSHLLVEPGPTLAGSFLRLNLVDRVWIFHSPRRVGDAAAPSAAKLRFPVSGKVMLGGDQLTEHLNPQSPVFFALEKSADLVLTTA
ncbi:MAG: bifunctional diaminohydroxyphosphoribosylaminopyrimidine deaminase/5-amino-6-(5-phosphoribosylamino)uracil reductase RibD [Planctomycetota bacterium]|nr:bifunctional diaminohydroxyphosphoribosylaminopyrimidine deaminase/5-amino-6-(5-phosphoribosylamino)uracil reductase RibD [Planctomycetota bacterium]